MLSAAVPAAEQAQDLSSEINIARKVQRSLPAAGVPLANGCFCVESDCGAPLSLLQHAAAGFRDWHCIKRTSKNRRSKGPRPEQNIEASASAIYHGRIRPHGYAETGHLALKCFCKSLESFSEVNGAFWDNASSRSQLIFHRGLLSLDACCHHYQRPNTAHLPGYASYTSKRVD
jgi:hypothetical protein